MSVNKDINYSDHLYGMDQIIGGIVGDNSNVEIQPQQIKEVLQDIMKQDGVLDNTVIGGNSMINSSDTLNIDSILGESTNSVPSVTDPMIGLFDIKTNNNAKQPNNSVFQPTPPNNNNSTLPAISEHEGFNVLSSVVNDYNNQGVAFVPKIVQQKNTELMNSNVINNIVANEDKTEYRELINTLRNALESEGDDVSDIPKLTGKESIETLVDISKILDRRYNRKQDFEIGEGIFTTMAKFMEDTFDGSKTVFNSKPNLRGLTPKVQKTISHMKIEVANEVARFRNKYFHGFLGRFLMTMIPSIYLLASNNAERDAEIQAGEGTPNFTNSDFRKSIADSIN